MGLRKTLIMELVAGETLEDRIKTGPLAWDDALPLVRQICDALAYAHDQGVIHRDLKPANIKITSDGQVKILDFGLAKAISSESSTHGITPNPADLIDAPTLSLPVTTMAGTVLGTPAYMAPEQARGQNVDRRADIWAFGVLLYEMLSGERPFGGPTLSDTLAAVLKESPDLGKIPQQARRLIQSCLEKDRRKRLGYIGDAILLTETASANAAGTPVAATGPINRMRRILPWPAGLLAGACLVLAWQVWRSATAPLKPPMELGLPLASGQDLGTANGPAFAIAPDGKRLVYQAGNGHLYLRNLSQSQPISLHVAGVSPFFSPDSHWIGFYGAAGALETISIFGGSPNVLTNANSGRGAAWSARGFIIYPKTITSPLYKISPQGGAAIQVTRLHGKQITQRWPQLLPGGRFVLYTASPNNNDFSNADIEVASLASGQARVLEKNAYFGRYLPNGFLIYVSGKTLFGAPFNPHSRSLTGPPFPILRHIHTDLTNGSAQLSFANNGTAVYLTGQSLTTDTFPGLVNRKGKFTAFPMPPGAYSEPRLSPRGHRLALVKDDNLWIYNLTKKTLNPITYSNPNCDEPVWSPHGSRIACTSPAGPGWLYANGQGNFHLWLRKHIYLESWAPDGHTLVGTYNLGSPELILHLPSESAPVRVTQTTWLIGYCSISPDGKWIAYMQHINGRNEVFVSPYPAMNSRWQVSSGQGIEPVWSKSGHEIFYVGYGGAQFNLFSVPYQTEGNTFIPGNPVRLFRGNYEVNTPSNFYDATPDGRHFMVLSPASSQLGGQNVHPVNEWRTTQFPTVVFHWFNRVMELARQRSGG